MRSKRDSPEGLLGGYQDKKTKSSCSRAFDIQLKTLYNLSLLCIIGKRHPIAYRNIDLLEGESADVKRKEP